MTSQIGWRQTLRFYTKVVVGTSAVGYGWLYLKWAKLRQDINNEELVSLKKDTTRPTNEYYGINWGYRADNTIEKSFETGDVVLFDYKCDKCLYPKDILKWYAKKLHKNDEFSQVGFVFKTPMMLFVVFSLFGTLQIMPYSEFLNRPYFSRIKARNFENPPVDITKRSMEFIQNLKDITEGTKEQEKSSRHTDVSNEKIREYIVRGNIDRVTSIYFNYLGVLRVNPLAHPIGTKDYDMDRPHIFHKDYTLGGGFIIRSETSKNLKDNMNFK